MKKSILILAGVMFTGALAFAEAEVGKPAPDFTAKDINGQTHKLSDYKGKIVVLESYNLDCPYVANQYNSGAIQELQADATGKGVVWLLVNSSYKEAAKAKKEVASKKIKATAVLLDPSGATAKPYGFKTTPHMIVLNKDGIVAYNGAIDDKADPEADPRKARNYVREAIGKLSAGESVTVSKTKPYGCGYKIAD